MSPSCSPPPARGPLSALLLSAAVLVAAIAPVSYAQGTYHVVPRAAIRGQDVQCAQQDYNGTPLGYCKVCGATAAISACAANPSCRTVVMDRGGSCGYLKAAAAPTYYAEDFVAYLPGPAPKGGYSIALRQALPGQELSCAQQDYSGKPVPWCRLCDGPVALISACDANPACVGFDMQDRGGCGYLKVAGKGQYAEGTVSYIKTLA